MKPRPRDSEPAVQRGLFFCSLWVRPLPALCCICLIRNVAYDSAQAL